MSATHATNATHAAGADVGGAPGAGVGASPLRPDAPGGVRPGEELDIAALVRWMAGAVPGLEAVTPDALTVAQYGGGFSNLTYLVQVRAGAPGAGDQGRVGSTGDGGARHALVLRRPPFGVGRGPAHDMAREYRLLAALHPTFGRVPRPVAVCDDPAVLGAPFYLMAHVPGVILRGRPGDPVPDATTMRGLSERLVDELAALHRFDWRAAGLGALARPEGYVARQVRGWTERWTAARTTDVPPVERVAAWLAGHLPPAPDDAAGAATLLHNDFKYDNFVLDPTDPTRIVAVLDWEMAAVGDPLMDLGTSLGYWLDPDDPPALRALGLGLTAAPGNLSRRAVVERYATATGRDVSHALFYYVFGVFKLAVVAQQIFARHARGLTRDPRFARLDAAVAALGHMADRAIALDRIDRLG